MTELHLPDDGVLVMLGVVGSTAYGLASDDSDVDRLGIYVAATSHVLGLSGCDVVKNTVVQTDPDTTVHEVGKFMALALKGNPTITELLFLDTYEPVQPSAPEQFRGVTAKLILDHRSTFLGADNIRSAYGGYATQQARRLLNRHKEGKDGFNSDLRQRTAKHGRHCYRLLLQGEQLLTTGSLTLNVSDRRDEIFAVGDMAVEDPEGFERYFTGLRGRLDQIDSVLPAQPDRETVDSLLVNIRHSY